MFDKEYDPFFMRHYDVKGKKVPKCSHKSIDELFTLSLNYACRLFKAKSQIVDALESQNNGASS